ncbi:MULTISPECIES: paraquat-inducible protein A [unclassified Pseudoalteromonas]|uniref:paraquat-inducible protein A n=1 Tax=unclassified Pseudoalteromonas TaxID=194690 RepID=UPI0005A8ADF8|nr:MULTISPECIES: paraquat-inducible protein A [unclassified Pseudoalteromonas]
MIKKHIGFALNILAIALFIPGIYFPMFSLNMDMAVNVANTSLTSDLVNKQLSLIETIQELYQDDRMFVALLILLFSICIPLIKTLLVSFAYFKRNTVLEAKIYEFVSKIGKWSMADVFIVAIFLAVLSTNHAETANNQALVIFGFQMELMISSRTLSAVGQGFYYFVGYCLLSLLATQISFSSLTVKAFDITQVGIQKN